MFIVFVITIILFYIGYKKQEKKNSQAFINEMLILIAYIAGADNKASALEQKYINYILLKRFGKNNQQKYFNLIKYHSKEKTPISKAINRLNKEASMSKKLQILQILIKIATVDEYLTNKELSALSEITLKLKLTYFQLESLLAMCNFTSEKRENEKRNYKKQKTVTRASKLNRALTILELDQTATDTEIKKAYRKLAIIHHPDKVLSLNKAQQKLSKEKFLKISEAYELLKTNKGFK